MASKRKVKATSRLRINTAARKRLIKELKALMKKGEFIYIGK